MKEYKLKSRNIKAIQLERTKESIAKVYYTTGNMMKTGLKYLSNEQHKWLEELEHMLKIGYIMLEFPEHAFKVNFGDYIILDEEGFDVIDGNVFESNYVEV